jgi:hypothetical protein
MIPVRMHWYDFTSCLALACVCRFDDLHDFRSEKHSVALFVCGLFENPFADWPDPI